MQKIIIASSLVVVVGLTAAFALSRTGDAAAADAEASRTVTLAVEGMDCAACPITVRMGLERLAGVEVDRVDIASGTLGVIVTDDAVTDDQLLQAVANTGYHATIGEKPAPERAVGADARWDDRVPEPDRWIRQTALFPNDAGQRTSLLWLDDYAAAPVEADLVETMARLLP